MFKVKHEQERELKVKTFAPPYVGIIFFFLYQIDVGQGQIQYFSFLLTFKMYRKRLYLPQTISS